MKKVLLMVASVLLVSAAGLVAQTQPGTPGVPEIDASTASSALALLSGALMMLRRKR